MCGVYYLFSEGRVCSRSPSVLFLDEPTSGLDSYTAHQVMKAVKRLVRFMRGALQQRRLLHDSLSASPNAARGCSSGRLGSYPRGLTQHRAASEHQTAHICADLSMPTLRCLVVVHPFGWCMQEKEGITICATIHCPSIETFRLFDRVLLLQHGRVVYHGDNGAPVVDYFVANFSDVRICLFL